MHLQDMLLHAVFLREPAITDLTHEGTNAQMNVFYMTQHVEPREKQFVTSLALAHRFLLSREIPIDSLFLGFFRNQFRSDGEGIVLSTRQFSLCRHDRCCHAVGMRM